MSVICCTINEFDNTANVYLQTENAMTSISNLIIENIEETLPAICSEYSVDNLHLFGNDSYLSGIVERIKAEEKTLYKNNNLNIEVN